eukprot:00830_3
MRKGRPWVDLMWRERMFCQFFLRRETRKLTVIWTLVKISCSVRLTFPTATPMQSTFLSWSLTVERTSLILSSMLSPAPRRAGNLPALLRPGPRIRGICLRTASEAMKASYLAASFLMSFLFLLSFLRSSTLMLGIPCLVASSLWAASPRTQTERRGRGVGRRTCPEKRLSFWVSFLRPIWSSMVSTKGRLAVLDSS